MVLAFTQQLTPLGGIAGSTLLALVPVVVLLILLAVFRMSAWQAVILGSAVTILLAIFVWKVPTGPTFASYGLGAVTGLWAVDWIVLWGVVIYNTLVVTESFDRFKQWLVEQATADIRIQTLLMAWAFGALLEGLVGFGYPWAVVAPILIVMGVRDLDAIRVSAIANNAPVSFGALGAPIIGLAAVTGLPLYDLSASIGKIVAVLALLPPFILIYLVSGRRGLRDGWPIAIVASLGYIVGQFPTSQFIGPYLPDVIGAITAFGAILVTVRIWRPASTLGFGGVELTAEQAAEVRRRVHAPAALSHGPGAATADPVTPSVWRGVVPFLILIAVVIAWTGPWSGLTKWTPFAPEVTATSASGKTVSAVFKFAPLIAGTSILASWLLILAYLRPKGYEIREVFTRTFRQTWGAMLVGLFIFGLAYVFNFSGMAASMAHGFSKMGKVYLLVAPILGWIAVALSGSNTSANAIFGKFQMQVGALLGFPLLLFPALNSVGAEVGKPVAPQTASVGVSTTGYVRNEGEVIRYNMPWTLLILLFLIGIGALYYFVFPAAMKL